MQIYISRTMHFLYIFTILYTLLEELQEYHTSKQIISLDIKLKCIISDYNQGHILHELQTQDKHAPHNPICILMPRY